MDKSYEIQLTDITIEMLDDEYYACAELLIDGIPVAFVELTEAR